MTIEFPSMQCIVFIHVVLTLALVGSSNKIFWTDLPFIIGRNVTLFCNTSHVGLLKTTWIKQSDVIVHFGFSFYPDKYTANEVNDGSTLTIMNATFTDCNTSYTCLSDEYIHEEVLNCSNIIYLPESTDITVITTERTVFIQMNLDSCFPVPECITMLHDDTLITEQQESSYLTNGLFSLTMNMTSQSDVELCGGNLTVVCRFGDSYSEKIWTHVLQNCKGSKQFGYRFEFIGTVAGVFVPVFSMCCIYCSMFIYQYKSKKEMEEQLPEDKSLVSHGRNENENNDAINHYSTYVFAESQPFNGMNKNGRSQSQTNALNE